MTTETFGMEMDAIKSLRTNLPSEIGAKLVDYIEEMLHPNLRGRTITVWNTRGPKMLFGKVNTIINFPGHGEETITIQIPLMSNDIDICERLAFCINERYHQLTH